MAASMKTYQVVGYFRCSQFVQHRNVITSLCSYFCTGIQSKKGGTEEFAEDDFSSFNLTPKKEGGQERRKRFEFETMPPRSNRMPIDQDWTSVWPAASTFKASVVPLPIRMGWDTKDGSTPPSKYGNAELMKIPNFLHLTPLHIKKHCEAIKKFCTEWPTNLTTSKAMEKHFPVEVKYSDFCYSSPSIREPQSRIVTLSVKLSSLELDYHARDKLLRLVGDQYNAKTDTLTIFADRCPTRKQNYDYVQYLLTAIYHESWKTEPWEHEKEESDWEVYFWEKSISKKNVLELLRRLEPEATTVEILERPDVHTYCKSVQELHDDGEDLSTLSNYKLAVKKLLALS